MQRVARNYLSSFFEKSILRKSAHAKFAIIGLIEFSPEVGIFKRKILRKKRKYAFDQEKNKIQEKTLLIKKKKRKTRYLPRKKGRKQDMIQEKKQFLKSFLFSFL